MKPKTLDVRFRQDFGGVRVGENLNSWQAGPRRSGCQFFRFPVFQFSGWTGDDENLAHANHRRRHQGHNPAAIRTTKGNHAASPGVPNDQRKQQFGSRHRPVKYQYFKGMVVFDMKLCSSAITTVFPTSTPISSALALPTRQPVCRSSNELCGR